MLKILETVAPCFLQVTLDCPVLAARLRVTDTTTDLLALDGVELANCSVVGLGCDCARFDFGFWFADLNCWSGRLALGVCS